MSSPFITVIVTAYNRRDFLKHAVRSALDQTLDRSSYELIVTKDFKDKEVDDIISSNDITGILHEGSSIGKRMAIALERAKGEVIAFLDDDDTWENNKLSHLCDVFSTQPDLCFYHNSQSFMDNEGKSLSGPKGWDPVANMDSIGELKLLPSAMRGCDALKLSHLFLAFNASSIAVRKDVLERHLDFLEELNSSPEDFLLYSSLLSNRTILAESLKLTRYRIHTKNVSERDSAWEEALEGSSYLNRQIDDYFKMSGHFDIPIDSQVMPLFSYSMNILRLTSLLRSNSGSRRKMGRVAFLHCRFAMRYLFCLDRGSAIRGKKFGMWYNVRLLLLSLLFMCSPGIARVAYAYLYLGMNNR